ncbi:unnamed protein product [Trypanosoma congolense IL3000]|uniref:WGS project CAEQ00000000 data, annotated contig 1133 n=1 Tax=Trypanosoma congolense (strain IL3000) TaxID=1068625 RepID=F9W407_TRYCI|nr:unnamed protein product [Trypanosoma congolense IL3000]
MAGNMEECGATVGEYQQMVERCEFAGILFGHDMQAVWQSEMAQQLRDSFPLEGATIEQMDRVASRIIYAGPGFVWERLLLSCYFPLKVARWRLSRLNIGLACPSDPSALSRKALILSKVCVCEHVVKKHTSGPNTSPASHGRSGCGRFHAWLWSDVILRFGRNFNSGRCL